MPTVNPVHPGARRGRGEISTAGSSTRGARGANVESSSPTLPAPRPWRIEESTASPGLSLHDHHVEIHDIDEWAPAHPRGIALGEPCDPEEIVCGHRASQSDLSCAPERPSVQCSCAPESISRATRATQDVSVRATRAMAPGIARGSFIRTGTALSRPTWK